jgi:FKBP-type peptidyl-prolyl cis-trans isomerase (trigger factor)
MAKKQTENTKPVTTTKAGSTPEVVVGNTVLKLIIPAATTKRAYQQALEKAASKTKTAGFRQGKVPLPMVEKMVGEAELINAALDQILPVAYEKLISREEKSPLTNPEIKLVSTNKGEDWELSVEIAEKPPVSLGNYSKIVKEAREKAQKELAAAAKDKKADKKDGEAAHDHDHAGHDHDHDHAGHDHSHEASDEDRTLQGIFRALLESTVVQIPELLLKHETRQQLDGLVRQLEGMKLSIEDYLKHQHQTFEELTGQVAASSLANLQLEFILEAIAEDLKIEVSDDEVKAELASRTKAADSEVKQDNPYLSDYLKRTLHRRKLIAHLLGEK